MRTMVAAALMMLAGFAQAYEAGDLLFRGGVATVAPDASSAELALDGSAIAGSKADVDDGTAIGLTFVYIFSDKIGLEVLASTPFSHDISADTGALGLGTVSAGETKHLPPTVSLQYFRRTLRLRFSPTWVQASTTPCFSTKTSTASSKACWDPAISTSMPPSGSRCRRDSTTHSTTSGS